MKHAKDWIQEKTRCPFGRNVVTDRFYEKDIEAIQRDALSEARKIAIDILQWNSLEQNKIPVANTGIMREALPIKIIERLKTLL